MKKSALLLLALLCLAPSASGSEPDPEPVKSCPPDGCKPDPWKGFQGLQWGDSLEQAHVQGPPKHSRALDWYSQKKCPLIGKTCTLNFGFLQGALVQGMLIIDRHYDLNQGDGYLRDFEEIKDALILLYGKSSMEDTQNNSGLFEENPGMALTLGLYSPRIFWDTPTTQILLTLSSENHQVNFAVIYVSKTHWDAVKTAASAEAGQGL